MFQALLGRIRDKLFPDFQANTGYEDYLSAITFISKIETITQNTSFDLSKKYITYTVCMPKDVKKSNRKL